MNKLRWTLLVLLVVPIAASAQGPGVFALRTMLQDKNPEIRMKAAEGLGRVGGRQGIIILRQGLSDNSPTVRIAVVEALGFIGGRLSMTVLSAALKDKSPQVRIRAVEALKDAGTVNSIPIIQKAFGDKEESVRLHAALMLTVIGHRRGVPVLAKVAVDDKSSAVRAAAAAYLGKVGVKDRRAVGALAKVLEDKTPAVRIRAVEALGFLQLPQAIPVLKQALEDKGYGGADTRDRWCWGTSRPKISNNVEKSLFRSCEIKKKAYILGLLRMTVIQCVERRIVVLLLLTKVGLDPTFDSYALHLSDLIFENRIACMRVQR